jgi:hypothetical protein
MLAALGCAGVAAVTLDDVLDAALLDDLARLSDHELVACTAPPEVAALVTRDAQGSAQALLANLGRRPVDVVVADAVIPLAPGARAHTPLPTDAVARGPRA